MNPQINADTFLDENNVHADWITFIREEPDLLAGLDEGLAVVENFGDSIIPARKLILRALTICSPADIKVVLIARTPIPFRDLATGLAFSYPQGTTETGYPAMARMHQALRDADLPNPNNTSCFHESWAERGVLLLNAVLTTDPQLNYEMHEAWLKFTNKLVGKLCHQNKKLNIICWGTYAKRIADWLDDIHPYTYQCTSQCNDPGHKECWLFVSDHPTYPAEPEDNNFPTEGAKQFKCIDERCPGIFN